MEGDPQPECPESLPAGPPAPHTPVQETPEMAPPPPTVTSSGKQQPPLTISGIQSQGVIDPRTDISPELSGVAVTKDDYGFDSPMQDDELLSDEVLAELREIIGMVLLSRDEFPAHILLI